MIKKVGSTVINFQEFEAASSVTNQSLWLTIPLRTVPGSILPGQRTIAGTR